MDEVREWLNRKPTHFSIGRLRITISQTILGPRFGLEIHHKPSDARIKLRLWHDSAYLEIRI